MYTLAALNNMPTLEQGYTDNLKVHTSHRKVWLSRMTVEDGMPYNNQVTVEARDDNVWHTVCEYEAV